MRIISFITDPPVVEKILRLSGRAQIAHFAPKTWVVTILAEIERPIRYYFGDNRDDLTTLLCARRELQETDLYFVYCLSDSADPATLRWFASNGATLIAVEIEDALSALQV